MTITRFRVLAEISVCLTIALVATAGGQVSSQDSNGWTNPYKQLDSAASLVKADTDQQSIRALADAVFAFPRALPPPPEMILTAVKDRLVAAEIAYRTGKQGGVFERDIVKLVNSLAEKFGVPSYGKTGLTQVRVLRMQLALSSPIFMGAGLTHDKMQVGESVPQQMSPLQAAHLINSLVDQKLINPDFQVPPEEWEQLHLAAALAKIQQMQQAQKSGGQETKLQKGEIRAFNKKRDLQVSLLQAGSSLSFTDAMNLLDQAFTTLKIGR